MLTIVVSQMSKDDWKKGDDDIEDRMAAVQFK